MESTLDGLEAQGWDRDGHLIEELRAGSEDAFVFLVNRYHASMVGVASRFVSSRSVTEEVVQIAIRGGRVGMRVVSVNVGSPRSTAWKGRIVTTGIFKEPVTGRVAVRTLNLDGDRQADLSVHGGATKAVYVYPAEHYGFWRGEFPALALPWGMFGENITSQGLLEESIRIGDRIRVGSAELMVTEPRMPCHKLGLKFGRDDIIKRFLASGRTGFYCAVVREGEVAPGDHIEWISRDGDEVTVSDITRLYASKRGSLDLLRRAVQVQALPEGWRSYFQRRLQRFSG